jgi:hypothetical protein
VKAKSEDQATSKKAFITSKKAFLTIPEIVPTDYNLV